MNNKETHTSLNTNILRIDKYLWAVRIYKTREEAADALRGGKVWVNGQEAKPSREVKVDDMIVVRKGAIRHSYKVLALLTQRVAAKNVAPYILDCTSPEELAKEAAHKEMGWVFRDRGAGRPTKKERRDLEKEMNRLK